MPAISDMSALLGGAVLLASVGLGFAPHDSIGSTVTAGASEPGPSSRPPLDPKGCLDASTGGDDDYGQIDAMEEDGYNTTMRGVRAHMYASKGAHCQRVSSIAVEGAGGGTFEFGWLRGWWGPSSCQGVDHDHYYSHPTLFNVRVTNAGHYSCRFWAHRHPSDGSFDTYRASDANANTYWGCRFNGISLQPHGVNMDFSEGTGVVNMERGNQHDGGYADWTRISEYHDGNGWSYFDNVRKYYDIDPDYHFHRIDGHHAKSIQ